MAPRGQLLIGRGPAQLPITVPYSKRVALIAAAEYLVATLRKRGIIRDGGRRRPATTLRFPLQPAATPRRKTPPMSQTEIPSSAANITRANWSEITPQHLYDKCMALARNLWWSWHPEVVNLFRDLDPV